MIQDASEAVSAEHVSKPSLHDNWMLREDQASERAKTLPHPMIYIYILCISLVFSLSLSLSPLSRLFTPGNQIAGWLEMLTERDAALPQHQLTRPRAIKLFTGYASRKPEWFGREHGTLVQTATS